MNFESLPMETKTLLMSPRTYDRLKRQCETASSPKEESLIGGLEVRALCMVSDEVLLGLDAAGEVVAILRLDVIKPIGPTIRERVEKSDGHP